MTIVFLCCVSLTILADHSAVLATADDAAAAADADAVDGYSVVFHCSLAIATGGVEAAFVAESEAEVAPHSTACQARYFALAAQSDLWIEAN